MNELEEWQAQGYASPGAYNTSISVNILRLLGSKRKEVRSLLLRIAEVGDEGAKAYALAEIAKIDAHKVWWKRIWSR